MKFTSIRLEGLNDIDLYLSNADPSDPYILKSAEGLGPPEIDISIAATRHMDGYYKGRNAQYREIVLTIGLNPNYRDNITVSDLRSRLYGLLSAGSSDSIDVVIIDDDKRLMRTTGYIKKMEIVPFSANPEVQLTIPCVTACFQAQNDVYVDISSDLGWQDVDNIGTAETGIVFQATALEPAPVFELTDDRQNFMFVYYPFVTNDTIIVDTRPGSR